MITLTTEQAQQIEEALVATLKNNDYWLEKCTGALDTIRAARTQEQAEQEPVLCVECGKPTMHMGNKCYACCQKDTKDLEDALKSWDAAPVQQVDLTDDEIYEAVENIIFDENFDINIARAVIAKYKEKQAND